MNENGNYDITFSYCDPKISIFHEYRVTVWLMTQAARQAMLASATVNRYFVGIGLFRRDRT